MARRTPQEGQGLRAAIAQGTNGLSEWPHRGENPTLSSEVRAAAVALDQPVTTSLGH